MSRLQRRAVRRFQCAACLFSLVFALTACITGRNSSPPGPAGFGITATELRGAVSLERFSQSLADLDAQDKTPSSGRQAAPLQVAGATVMTDGVGSFNRFRGAFLDAVSDDRRNDYLDHILFPLRLIDYRRSDGAGSRVSSSRFNAQMIYDATTLRRTGAAPVPLGDAFTGQGSEALYWGDRLLVFRPVEGRWMLTESGSCEDASCKPADLLCRGFDPRRAFPGRTPHGYEDFNAFYRAFYCMGDTVLRETEPSPAGSTLASRIRFPLPGFRTEPGADIAEPLELDIDAFEPALLFPSRRAVPQTVVDGIEARAIVGVDDGHQVITIFNRVDGLWYLTALLG